MAISSRKKIKATSVFILALLSIAVVLPGCINRPAAWGNPGEARKEFLGSKYDKIVVEVDYDSNTNPDNESLSLLRQRLVDVCRKDVEIRLSDKFTVSKREYTIQDVHSIQNKYRNYHNQYIDFGKSVFYAFVLYLDGKYSDGNVIGLAYSADSFCIFQENIKNNVNPFGVPPTARQVEKSVLVHEFGHLLGLVSRGEDTAYKYKEDTQHEHHCENKNCVMYHAIDTTDIISAFLNQGTPNDFCESCRLEMNTYR